MQRTAAARVYRGLSFAPTMPATSGREALIDGADMLIDVQALTKNLMVH